MEDRYICIYPACVSWEKSFECQEIITLYDEIAIQAGFSALVETREPLVKLQNVVRDSVVIIFDHTLALELQHWH